MTQIELRRRLAKMGVEVSQGHLCQMCNGKRRCPTRFAVPIAKVLRIDPAPIVLYEPKGESDAA